MDEIDLTRRNFLFGRTAAELSEDETGASAIEYGLIGALVGVALVSSLSLVGRSQRRNFRCIIRAMRGREPNRFCERRGA
ncbi:MAG: Flp family type IVb pilin [Pseudomonadota bacterium]